jgi:hypothetical protein
MEETDIVRDTLNGLLAFVVPGPDTYSVAQGSSDDDPGGVEAGVMEVLIRTLDLSAPFLPHFSATVAGILNDLAQKVNPSAAGSLSSPFSRLSFAEKVAVFQMMDGTDSLKSLAGVLPAFVAYLCYSDAGVFDPTTGALTGKPVGWTISNYTGTADGREECSGYFAGRSGAEKAGV